MGGVASTTSTTRTGSLLLPTQVAGPSAGTGNIVFGADSLTTILPDESSGTLPTATVTSTTTLNQPVGSSADYFPTVLQPQINIQAQGSVDLQGHGAGAGGALIKAPGAAL